MKEYIKTYQVKGYETNRYGQTTIESICNYLQEMAMLHADVLEFGIGFIIKESMTWVLTRVELHINDYPIIGEYITIKTYPSATDRYYAYRDFIIYNAKEEIIAQSTTTWMMINLKNMAPTLISEKFKHFSKDKEPFIDINNIEKLKSPDKEQIINKIDFHVRRSDLDINQHVNNTKFVSWINEVFPENVYTDKMINKFIIEFRKECNYKDTVSSSVSFEKNIEAEIYNHVIYKNDESKHVCIAKSYVIEKPMRVSAYVMEKE